jgi:pyruvate dehydrogenase E2 component (dihydrolipoamide acetyltransferase)
VQKDVLEFKPKPAAEKRKPDAPVEAVIARISNGQKQVIPLTKMRQAIAKALQASKQNVPHFYETIDVDVEELSSLRLRINTALESQNIRLSIGDLISKAVTVALLKHPALNAHYSADKHEITRFGDVHLGFAVALPDGLIVPVLRNIDQMGLKEIRTRSADLIDRARAQRLKEEEMRGATFTVSNLGTYGVREFSAIINPPSVGILAVASAEKRAVVRNDQIVARTMMTLTLSADHRAVDGAVAADFLRTLKGLLEEPGMMLV